jgi:hypothetical protein
MRASINEMKKDGTYKRLEKELKEGIKLMAIKGYTSSDKS